MDGFLTDLSIVACALLVPQRARRSLRASGWAAATARRGAERSLWAPRVSRGPRCATRAASASGACWGRSSRRARGATSTRTRSRKPGRCGGYGACSLSLSLCTRGLCAAPARSASAMRRSSSGCGSTRVPESKRQSTDFHFFVAFVVRVVCLCVCFFAHCSRASGLTLSMTDSMRRCSHPRENGGLEKDDLLI